MTDIFQLYRLQLVDNQITKNESSVKTIEVNLKDDSALQEAEKKVADSLSQLQNLQLQLKHAENEVESQRLKIQNNNHSLYGGNVRNPKELQDLQNEAQALQRHLAILEDRQIEIMIATEDANSLYETHYTAREHLKADYADLSIQYQKELSILQNDLSRLSGERRAIISSLSNDTLVHYEQLREKRGGTAVAFVSDNACTACGTILSATLLHTARIPNKLTHCELCGRILYVG